MEFVRPRDSASRLPIAVLVASLVAPAAHAAAPPVVRESVCHGTPAHGSLERGCQLPEEGVNFTPYSSLGRILGRTYVHCTVAMIVIEAYGELARSAPGIRYVYGETGFAPGGLFAPHKSHQNGTSVDFFVPVRDPKGRSVPVPTGPLNRWGYDLEFDAHGRADDLTLDVEAMVAHLLALDRAARAHGVRLDVVIFDLALQPLLHRSPSWPLLASRVRFSTKPAWVRHDEHYHVNFAVRCRP